MTTPTRPHAAEAFRSAFGVAPGVAAEAGDGSAIGIYDWRTPDMDGFELPETDELVVALHLGGSRRVRAVTERGLSRACSIPGLVTILPPGRSAAFNTGGSIDVMTLHVPLQNGMAGNGALPSLGSHTMPRFAFRDAYVTASMEALLRAARGPRPPSPNYIAKLADALLCHLAEQTQTLPAAGHVADAAATAGQRIGTTPLADLLAYVEANLSRALPIDELARRAGVSRAGFTRSFRTATGMSTHQYLTQRRVAAAMHLLQNTEFDLVRIAQETGFSSQSHFTDTFHGLTGSTPRRFREQR